jgi:hypothetical protein
LFTLQAINSTPTGNPGPRWTPPSPALGGSSTTFNSWINSVLPTPVSLDLVVTATWQAANAQDPPPTRVQLLETALAGYGVLGGGLDITWQVDDSLGDTPVYTFGNSVQRTSQGGAQGSHLLICDGSSGTFTFTRNLSVSSNSASLGFVGSSTVSYSVAIDSRAVTISSSIDPTYHKDPLLGKMANVPANDGTISADSVNRIANINNMLAGSYGGPAITYYGVPTGTWTAGSAYHWYSASQGTHAAGTFTLPNDPPYDFPVFYPLLITGKEHINLNCMDSNDGIQISANYYVKWHDEFENWFTPVDFKQYGDFVRVTAIYHPIVEDAKFSYDVENSVKITVKATGEGSLEIKDIAAKFGIEIGAEYESATKTTVEYPLVANKANWIERQAFWRHREGTVDNYEVHGYVAVLQWTLDSAYNSSNPLMDYGEFQRASVTDPPN